MYRRHFPNTLRYAHHCHMENKKQKLPQYLQPKWLKRLAKETPEAKWEINYIHIDPYPSALCNERLLALLK